MLVNWSASVFCCAFTRRLAWGHPIPGLKPGVKHGQAPTAQSLWRGPAVRNPHGPDADDSSDLL
jgi:hypothetical protein